MFKAGVSVLFLVAVVSGASFADDVAKQGLKTEVADLGSSRSFSKIVDPAEGRTCYVVATGSGVALQCVDSKNSGPAKTEKE